MKKFKLLLALVFSIFLILSLAFRKSDSFSSNKPIKIGYIGEAYEAPLFVAEKKQYFENSGIKVELIKEENEKIKEDLFSGSIDGITANYSFFNYLDQGLDFKLVAGLHSGCVEIIAPESSEIKYFKDLTGRTLGVEALGNGPMTALSSLLRKKGMEPVKEIEWRVYDNKNLQKAVEEKQIDGAVIWEGTKLDSDLKVIYRTSGQTSSHNHSSNQHFFESFIALKSSFVKTDPQRAAVLSKEWIKAAEWVGKNIGEAADITVNGSYVSDISINECYDKLALQMWMPGVRYVKDNLKDYVKEQKEQKLISEENDEEEFIKKYLADIIPDYRN